MTADERTPVALIGFGLMGRAMAGGLRDNGHRVRVFDVSPAARAAALDGGCEFASSPADAARDASVALISLPRPEHVTAVVREGPGNLLGAMPAGSVIVDTSTVSPRTSEANAAEASRSGIGYLDAPVLGRPEGVGRWTLPVGGDAADLERARPVLACIAQQILPVGPPGSGNTVKLLNNLMFGSINAVTCEVFALAEKLGVDRALFFDIVSSSGAATVSNLFLALGKNIVADEFSPTFSVANLHKDVSLGVAMAHDAGAELAISENTLRLIERAVADGLDGEDTAAIVKTCAAGLG
jgi:3-hydroxyisobutyrate dehydrogenase-like beta-hydroxyacid dehydrogenase